MENKEYDVFFECMRRIFVSYNTEDGDLFRNEDDVLEYYDLYGKYPDSGYFWFWMIFSKN